MSTPDSNAPPIDAGSRWSLARPRPAWLLWGGGGACLAGMIGHGLHDAWAPSRTVALFLVALFALGGAWVLRRTTGLALAHGLAIAALLALALFGGPVPMAATGLAAAAAIALGGILLPHAGAAAQCVTGMALGAGVLGWLMPLPVHSRWTYLVVVVALLAARHRAVAGALRDSLQSWRGLVAGSPRATALMVLVLGLAATGCWVPTSQFDDVGYHLLLPWSLMLEGRLAMDPDVHAWALAPWAADVVQAVPQLLGGVEARGAVNALWLVLGAVALWRLCAALGGSSRARAWTVTLYASLPLTAALAMGMQTELATATLLAWAALLGFSPPSRRTLLAACAIVGLLLATKLAAAVFAVLLLPWLAWRHRTALDAKAVLLGITLLVVIGGASYTYAWFIAGNPVLPLMNDYFGSPWFGGRFVDARWAGGPHPALPWTLTFDTDRYLEAHPGGGGFAMVTLAGAWLMALWQRSTRGLAALALAMVVIPLLTVQYLRYVYPALVLALPALCAAAFNFAPRSAHVLLAATCIANLAFQANSHWMLRNGVVKDVVVTAGRDAPILSEYAAERLVAALVRERWEVDGDRPGAVLALDLDFPMLAELGSAARTTTWYDPSLSAAADVADGDPSGQAWIALWQREGISDLVVREHRLAPARSAALALAGATREGEVDEVSWWRLPWTGATAEGDGPAP